MRRRPSDDAVQLVRAIAAALKSMLKYREEPKPVLVFLCVTTRFFFYIGLSSGSGLARLI